MNLDQFDKNDLKEWWLCVKHTEASVKLQKWVCLLSNGLTWSWPMGDLWDSKASANERRRYICNVFTHWLRPCSAIDISFATLCKCSYHPLYPSLWRNVTPMKHLLHCTMLAVPGWHGASRTIAWGPMEVIWHVGLTNQQLTKMDALLSAYFWFAIVLEILFRDLHSWNVSLTLNQKWVYAFLFICTLSCSRYRLSLVYIFVYMLLYIEIWNALNDIWNLHTSVFSWNEEKSVSSSCFKHSIQHFACSTFQRTQKYFRKPTSLISPEIWVLRDYKYWFKK